MSSLQTTFRCDECADRGFIPTEAGELVPCPTCEAERWAVADLAARDEELAAAHGDYDTAA